MITIECTPQGYDESGEMKYENFTEVVEVKKFPAGESVVCISDELRGLIAECKMCADVTITLDFQSNDDLINLLLVVDAMRREAIKGEGKEDWLKISLIIPYFPYARQDRVCNPGEPFSAKVIANLINSQNFVSVTCQDIHSDAAAACINNFINEDCLSSVESLFYDYDLEKSVLVAPDAGAIKKVYALATELRSEGGVVCAMKKRDTKTGEITKTEVHSPHIGSKDFLIVDDICDGGRTFLELAKVLRPLTDGKIYLYVTHGIFSKGIEVFEGVIDGIFVSNLMNPNKSHPLVKKV